MYRSACIRIMCADTYVYAHLYTYMHIFRSIGRGYRCRFDCSEFTNRRCIAPNPGSVLCMQVCTHQCMYGWTYVCTIT